MHEGGHQNLFGFQAVENVPEAERLYEAICPGLGADGAAANVLGRTRFAVFTDRFGVS